MPILLRRQAGNNARSVATAGTPWTCRSKSSVREVHSVEKAGNVFTKLTSKHRWGTTSRSGWIQRSFATFFRTSFFSAARIDQAFLARHGKVASAASES